MKKALAILVKVIVTLVGGWVLAGVISSQPYEMPWFLDDSIRFVLRVTGNDGLANPDDMEVIATLIVLVASVMIVGIVVWLGARYVVEPVLRRFKLRSRSNSA
ncbi:hypothetical protein BWP39_17090 [Paraburkholderia acidicola]|uniref:Uncharacterized protein n=1 Tax=Paraburkholderia acidicola TaxID=1912599 RepID=A0A2A4F0R4_9BURK|nr:hypothetical protein [Paraburkholderia acidicola]PCE26238.1 hypothetical protein BWP39_17090 [Paraburkholderia acidicola]